MAYIGREPQIGNYQICDAISVVNGQAAYTMQVSSTNVIPESVNHMIVSLNGVIQKPGSSYTISSSTITFSSNLATGDSIDFIYLLGNVLDLGTPSDSTVTTAKLSGNLVTPGTLDVNGQELILDANANTSITADTDDQIDIKVAGADDFRITANTFTALSGSGVVIPDGGLTLGSTAVSSTAAELNLLDGGTSVGGSITLADADGVVVNDGGTMKTIPASDIKTYTAFNTDAAQVFNESGADVDFRVESDAETHAIFLQASDGKVGIDTSAPSAKFNVSNGGASGIEFEPEIATNTNRITNYNRSGSAYNIFRLDALQQEFLISGAQKLLIGTSGRFHTNTSTSPNGHLNLIGERGGSYRAIVFEHTGGGGQVGNITTGSSSVAYNTSSDYRLKESIVAMENATTRLKQLQPKRFNFKTDKDKTVDGFLAHEVSSIVPEAISGTKDETETKQKVIVNSKGNVVEENIEKADWEKGKIADSEGNTQYPTDSTWEATKVIPVYQSIDQSKLVPLLVKTIQELEARIKTLEDA